MGSNQSFFNLYNHGFVRVAFAIPEVRVADPAYNAEQAGALLEQASDQACALVVFPELGLSAYSCEDLFHQQPLLEGCGEALKTLVKASQGTPTMAVVGLPLRHGDLLYNCAAVFQEGRLLGVVPKTYLPNYREYYEARHFASGETAVGDTIELCGQHDVPFGSRLLFQASDAPLLRVHVEICEDLWTPVPPSSYAAMAGATVLTNLSASNITTGKDDYRRQLVANQSGRCMAAYVYCAAGFGESTTDLAWDGHGMIYENGTAVAESQRFAYHAQLVTAEVDLERLTQDRMRNNTFGQSVAHHRDALAGWRTVAFEARLPRDKPLLLERAYERFPYVPSDPAQRDVRCREVYEIQVQGLVKRLQAAGLQRAVIGVSGGLDSTQALLVCARAMDVLGLPRENVLAYYMPGFGSSDRTLEQARRLMAAVGCTAREIDIRPACRQMLETLDHPFARGEAVYDVTFENVQAGERTSHLFRLANRHEALVVGTSDLSELAQGWCTYGVGDHMAHYHVNASVPKTLVQYLLRWVIHTEELGHEASVLLKEILETPISPELVPEAAEANSEVPTQETEAVIGPYELQDFHLYYTLRFGFPPPKVAFLAYCAWRDRRLGRWPDIPKAQRHQYTVGEIKHWLGVFLQRFFGFSQFKRSCIANAPKVGSGGSLSPRSDYRAPSDSEAAAWLVQMERIPDQEP